MDVIEAIQTRRSIRKYQTTPVSDETLQQVLNAARLAPSWANTQCWRFVLVRQPEIKAKLAEALYVNNPALDAIRNAPVIIVACARLRTAGYYHDKATTSKGDWCMFDVGLAMENLVLAAHSMGLGTVHVGSFDDGKVATALGVPADYCVVEMTPLGYPEGEVQPRPRKELKEIVFYDKWPEA